MISRTVQSGANMRQSPNTKPSSRQHEATVPSPVSERGLSGETIDDASQRARQPNSDGGLRARLKRLFDTKDVPHEPALRLDGDWKNDVAQRICDAWVESRKKYDPHAVSIVALSRMKALDYERKHRDSIPEDQRLLPGNATKQDYYEAQTEAFLGAIGINGDDLTAMLESFKLAGTGGLHRQHVTAATTVSNVVIGTSQLLSSQHPAAATALYGVRLLLQGITTERILDSGWRRLRNAGTEDVLPHGRADAAPSAKNAPTMFGAAHDVIWELRGVKKNLRKMEAALKALEEASTVFEKSGTNADREKLEKATEKLEIGFAKICRQLEVKASYKVSSESAKIEFRGNQRYLGTSYAGTTLTLGAGLFSILTPVLGAAAAPITGGVSLATAALVATLYAGYQLSKGPSKDGEAKARRAIVALSKSADILSGDTVQSRKDRAAALKIYRKDRRKARLKFGKARAEAKETARAKLLARLEAISEQEKVGDLMDARRNWKTYRAHLGEVSKIEQTAAREEWPPSRLADRVARLEKQFQTTHQADFSTKVIADAWKNPMRIRMDTAVRLLKGKVAQSTDHLINQVQHPGLKARLSRSGNENAIDATRTELRKNLQDLFNLGIALRELKALKDGSDADPAAMHRAATAIGAIEDADVRSLFCGDGREQVEAADKAKKLTAGEAERYVYTNAGASSIGIGLNVGVGATDFGIGLAKASNVVHVGLDDPNPEGKPRIPEYNDYKFAAISQAGAPLMAHMNAGNRAAFQKTQMPAALKATIRPKDEQVELKIDLDSDIVHLQDGNGATKEKIDALVEQLASADSVPDKIILSMTQAPDTAAPGEAVRRNIAFNLRSTSAYHRARYKTASRREKLKVMSAKAGIIGRHAFMSIAGLPAQAIAQYNLKKTRAALEQAATLEHKVRETLSGVATTGIVPQGSQDRSGSDAGTDNELP
ncbi:hypothetical protein [Herbaspirillum sp. ST 5-3]|uniref:hypothetical protein n=1 Tax=Oxalobacteraceae TaxID=75682 RepID=UPI0010A4D980|nr:hypothetical protein [Herbaspirillum sp. ST 5-3]